MRGREGAGAGAGAGTGRGRGVGVGVREGVGVGVREGVGVSVRLTVELDAEELALSVRLETEGEDTEGGEDTESVVGGVGLGVATEAEGEVD